jgi:hypothetical protein
MNFLGLSVDQKGIGPVVGLPFRPMAKQVNQGGRSRGPIEESGPGRHGEGLALGTGYNGGEEDVGDRADPACPGRRLSNLTFCSWHPRDGHSAGRTDRPEEALFPRVQFKYCTTRRKPLGTAVRCPN